MSAVGESGRCIPPSVVVRNRGLHAARTPRASTVLTLSTTQLASAHALAHRGDDDGLLDALSRSIFVHHVGQPCLACQAARSASSAALRASACFALLALALALLGLCDLSLVIFQRTTDTFVEVNPRRRFVGKETLRKRIRIRHHHARQLLPRVQLARRP